MLWPKKSARENFKINIVLSHFYDKNIRFLEAVDYTPSYKRNNRKHYIWSSFAFKNLKKHGQISFHTIANNKGINTPGGIFARTTTCHVVVGLFSRRTYLHSTLAGVSALPQHAKLSTGISARRTNLPILFCNGVLIHFARREDFLDISLLVLSWKHSIYWKEYHQTGKYSFILDY